MDDLGIDIGADAGNSMNLLGKHHKGKLEDQDNDLDAADEAADQANEENQTSRQSEANQDSSNRSNESEGNREQSDQSDASEAVEEYFQQEPDQTVDNQAAEAERSADSDQEYNFVEQYESNKASAQASSSVDADIEL